MKINETNFSRQTNTTTNLKQSVEGMTKPDDEIILGTKPDCISSMMGKLNDIKSELTKRDHFGKDPHGGKKILTALAIATPSFFFTLAYGKISIPLAIIGGAVAVSSGFYAANKFTDELM
jgi:hypothetical protein